MDVPDLTNKQLTICNNHATSFEAILSGMAEARNECRNIFIKDKWNCQDSNENIFGFNLTALQIKEKAFLYAYISASSMISIAKGCSTGINPNCGCGNIPSNEENMEEKYGFRWSGCSDNVKYADSIVKHFFENKDNNKIEDIMSNHNFKIGRSTVKNAVKQVCKCHGISGSCQTKTCWMSTPKIDEIGIKLKELMNNARIVKNINSRSLTVKGGRSAIAKNLIYLEEFNNFCTQDNITGIIGVSGRECTSERHCKSLCCDRGYIFKIDVIDEPCNCKFEYCCKVTCESCKKVITRRFCK
uniref:Protein Wnt n=1 Tax=Parastrongyloides trichosuri TaxID=131310 RepID=A0A0N4ZQE6_PARTI